MKVLAQAGTPEYYANLDLQYLRGEIPLSIYTRLNNKPYWYNIELAKQEIIQEQNRRKEQEAKEKAYKEEYQKRIEAEAQKQLDKELPKLIDKTIADLMKGFK